MHRKFIALILASALAITGLSAAPARADGDTARIFGGLAILAIIGAALDHSSRNRTTVTKQYIVPSKPQSTRPLPSYVTRRDLPGACLRSRSVNGQQRNLYGARCLQKNYAYTSSLPYACQLGYFNGQANRVGYEPLCLRERGYRTARN
ncbi:MAG: hypothetical protein ACI8R4_002336 [Paracoccaceae bacterium]|jgi:hypothetical protein